jgi:hypothetical protein
MPVNDWSPIIPKLRGNWVTVYIQSEKTAHIIASHMNKILFESLITHLLSSYLCRLQKDYEQRVLFVNMDCKKMEKGFYGNRFSEISIYF